MRSGQATLARDVTSLSNVLADTSEYLGQIVANGGRVLVEGTQGFGLSVLHGGYYPYATSRDTSAAGALAETGLSPLDVDDVTLVVRAFPIRVGGNSGPLPNETTWERVTMAGGHDHDLMEFTTVTRRLRRVAEFTPELVVRALQCNRPTRLVMNHLDYVDHCACTTEQLTDAVRTFVRTVETTIGREIDLVGLSPRLLLDTKTSLALARPTEHFCSVA
jgi:adenylosuccinate synthase